MDILDMVLNGEGQETSELTGLNSIELLRMASQELFKENSTEVDCRLLYKSNSRLRKLWRAMGRAPSCVRRWRDSRRREGLVG